MVKKQKQEQDKATTYTTYLNTENLKQSIIINANQMIDLNGKIDTFNLIDKFIVDKNPIMQIKDDKGNVLNADKDNTYWLDKLKQYIEDLKILNDEDISNIDAETLKQKTINFNLNFLNKYVGGIKNNLIDLIDIQPNYANHLASALVDIQALEINNIGFSNFLQLNLDNQDASFKQYIKTDLLKQTQKQLLQIDNLLNKNKQDIDSIVKQVLYTNQILDSTEQVKKIIDDNKEYYEMLHKLYLDVDKLIEDIGNKYKIKDDELNKYANAVAPKQAKNKSIPLHLAKIFNNTYTLNNYTSIDKDKNDEKYDIQLNFSYENEFKDLRDIIFVDDINKNQISLLPIDLALFMGFTSLNNFNGGNIPITLTDAFKFISEDKKMRIRKGQKAYQLYDEKMQLFKSFKVKSIIKDKTSKKTLIEFKDAIPILENYRVHLASRNDMGYIIGASAILSILNFLSEQEGYDYLTTFSTASSYINDSQSNTIAILNMKYFLIIKILQMNNASKKGKIYNPHINLDDLYKQTAQLNCKSELNKTEKQRLRVQIETYLNHLKSNNLLKTYDYTPFNQISSKDSNKKLSTINSTSKSDLYIKI